jgi:hypothetical protein
MYVHTELDILMKTLVLDVVSCVSYTKCMSARHRFYSGTIRRISLKFGIGHALKVIQI